MESITSVADNRSFARCIPNCSLELLGGVFCSPFMSTVCSVIIVVAVVFAVMIATGEIQCGWFERWMAEHDVEQQAARLASEVSRAQQAARTRIIVRIILREEARMPKEDLAETVPSKETLIRHEYHPINPIGGMSQVPGKVITMLGADHALPPVVNNDWATIYANVQPRRENEIT